MGIYQFAIRQTWQGQEMRNVLYYSAPDDDNAALQAIADGLRSAWATNISEFLSTGWVLRSCHVRRVDLAGLPTINFGFTAGVLAGTDTGDPLAAQIALLVSFYAPVTKPNQARSYLAGWTETHLTSGVFDSARVANAQAWGEATLDPTAGAVTGVGRLTVEWSVDNTLVLGGNVLESAVGRSIPATQRRRRIGVGQ